MRTSSRPDVDVHPHPNRVALVRRDLAEIRALRASRGYNQTDFWRMYGVSQSAGSRMEEKGGVPMPVQILLALQQLGFITERNLVEAMRAAEEAGVPSRNRKTE